METTEKPGVQTTEFWITAITNLISLVVAVYALSGHKIDAEPLLALVPVAATVASSLVTVIYAASRSKVKAAVAKVAVDLNREQKAWDLAELAGTALDPNADRVPVPEFGNVT